MTLVKLEEARVVKTVGRGTCVQGLTKAALRTANFWFPTSLLTVVGSEVWVPQWMADQKKVSYF